DGRIVVAGSALDAAHDSVFALARFLAAGPQVGSFSASPDPVPAGGSVTLTAADVVALNPNSTITRVAFFQDSNGDDLLDSGDALLGYGTETGTGTWTYTFSLSGWAAGTSTVFAVAEDSYGVFSDPIPLSLSLT